MTRESPENALTRHRPALLVATFVGGAIAIGSLLAGMGGPMMFGAFLFLGGGLIYIATKPAV